MKEAQKLIESLVDAVDDTDETGTVQSQENLHVVDSTLALVATSSPDATSEKVHVCCVCGDITLSLTSLLGADKDTNYQL